MSYKLQQATNAVWQCSIRRMSALVNRSEIVWLFRAALEGVLFVLPNGLFLLYVRQASKERILAQPALRPAWVPRWRYPLLAIACRAAPRRCHHPLRKLVAAWCWWMRCSWPCREVQRMHAANQRLFSHLVEINGCVDLRHVLLRCLECPLRGH